MLTLSILVGRADGGAEGGIRGSLSTTLLLLVTPMSELDHVIHDAVVGQLVDGLEGALEGEGSTDELPLLLFDLNVDVVFNGRI